MTYATPSRYYRGYIFDLDGTVYLGDALLPTAGDTIRSLRKRGCRTVFISNNPTHTRQEYAARLARLGLPTAVDDILNSSQVMVDFLKQRMPGARLFVVGERPLCEDLLSAGFQLEEEPQRVEAVIASFDRTFVYRKLQIAFDAIRSGARFCPKCGNPVIPASQLPLQSGPIRSSFPPSSQPPGMPPIKALPSSQPRLCPNCQRTLRPGARFCPGCGKPVV